MTHETFDGWSLYQFGARLRQMSGAVASYRRILFGDERPAKILVRPGGTFDLLLAEPPADEHSAPTWGEPRIFHNLAAAITAGDAASIAGWEGA